MQFIVCEAHIVQYITIYHFISFSWILLIQEQSITDRINGWPVLTTSTCKYGRFWWKTPLQWRHNERDGVSNHQPHNCLLIKAPRHWPLWGEFTGDRWIHRASKWSVTRKKFPFDDVIMRTYLLNSCGMLHFVFIKLHTRIGYTLNNKNTSLCEYKLNQNTTLFMQWMNLEISSAKWRIFFLSLTLFNEYLCQLNAAEWWIYASVTYAIIGADIGLSPVCLT